MRFAAPLGFLRLDSPVGTTQDFSPRLYISNERLQTRDSRVRDLSLAIKIQSRASPDGRLEPLGPRVLQERSGVRGPVPQATQNEPKRGETPYVVPIAVHGRSR